MRSMMLTIAEVITDEIEHNLTTDEMSDAQFDIELWAIELFYYYNVWNRFHTFRDVDFEGENPVRKLGGK